MSDLTGQAIAAETYNVLMGRTAFGGVQIFFMLTVACVFIFLILYMIIKHIMLVKKNQKNESLKYVTSSEDNDPEIEIVNSAFSKR